MAAPKVLHLSRLGGDLALFVLWINHYTYVRRPGSERYSELLYFFIVPEDCGSEQHFALSYATAFCSLLMHWATS